LKPPKSRKDLEKATKEGAKRRAEIEERVFAQVQAVRGDRSRRFKAEYAEALSEAEKYGASGQTLKSIMTSR
jgi:hypothetical protein